MDQIIRIDWPRREARAIHVSNRVDAIAYLEDLKETLIRAGVHVVVRTRAERTVGLGVSDDDCQLVVSYQIAGEMNDANRN